MSDGVLLAFGPHVYEGVMSDPKRLPRWDFGVLADVRHSVATIEWDQPLPPALDSFRDDHAALVGEIGRYVVDYTAKVGLRPIVVAGTAYTDWRTLAAAPVSPEPALQAGHDQLVAGLREGTVGGVVMAHLLTVAGAQRATRRKAG